jgi:predicted nucleic acid-binding protein
MILYTDTSALVKKYVRETDSEIVVAFFDKHPLISTSVLAQVEMAAALSKAVRQNWIGEVVANKAWQDFLSHWPSFTRLPVSNAILERAADLAWRYNLRAYDSVHLASALAWQDVSGEKVIFACFDMHLLLAAQQEGLQVWPENMVTK